MRNISFAEGQFYHIYNRGVEKRNIFCDDEDRERFFESMTEFNSIDPIGSLYERSFNKLGSSAPKSEKLVSFVAYCLNPNHYHFILKQVSEKGIQKFMHKLGTGYTNFFNEKYERSGGLFQGKFKAKHIQTDSYLLHLSAYVNLNMLVHKLQLGSRAPKLQSSWHEYLESENAKGSGFCEKDIILGQFNSVSVYRGFALNSLKNIIERRTKDDKLTSLFLE